jgi:hypothetical protein
MDEQGLAYAPISNTSSALRDGLGTERDIHPQSVLFGLRSDLDEEFYKSPAEYRSAKSEMPSKRPYSAPTGRKTLKIRAFFRVRPQIDPAQKLEISHQIPH